MKNSLDKEQDLLYSDCKDWKTLLFTMTKIDAREVYNDDELPLEFPIPSSDDSETYY